MKKYICKVNREKQGAKKTASSFLFAVTHILNRHCEWLLKLIGHNALMTGTEAN